MQNSMTTDTELDNSIDLDVSAKPLLFETDNLTKSVFNITLNDNDDECKNAEFENYEASLKQELKEWETLWREAYQNAKKAKQKHDAIDTSQLPAEQQAFLEKKPNLQKFLRESIEFRKAANMYLEMDYAKTIDLQKNLIEICERKLNVFKETKIAEWLANKR